MLTISASNIKINCILTVSHKYDVASGLFAVPSFYIKKKDFNTERT